VRAGLALAGRDLCACEVLPPRSGHIVPRVGQRDPRALPGAGLPCDHRVVTEREEFITWVHSVLRDAEIAVHNGDAGPRRAIWSRNDPVTVLGAWKNASGQQELDQLFNHLASSFSNCTSFEFELLEAEVRGDTAYTVGIEHTSASVNGVPRTYTLRATQIYRREDGAWRVAHRHGSAPPK
jgi:ketosteroid isomerase-like protein